MTRKQAISAVLGYLDNQPDLPQELFANCQVPEIAEYLKGVLA